MNGYRGVVFGSVTMIFLIYNIIIEFLSTRLAYPVFILNDLLDELDKTPGTAVHMLYDIAVAFTDQPKTRFNNTTVLIKHPKQWWSYSLCTCLPPNKEIPNMDIHYIF